MELDDAVSLAVGAEYYLAGTVPEPSSPAGQYVQNIRAIEPLARDVMLSNEADPDSEESRTINELWQVLDEEIETLGGQPEVIAYMARTATTAYATLATLDRLGEHLAPETNRLQRQVAEATIAFTLGFAQRHEVDLSAEEARQLPQVIAEKVPLLVTEQPAAAEAANAAAAERQDGEEGGLFSSMQALVVASFLRSQASILESMGINVSLGWYDRLYDQVFGSEHARGAPIEASITATRAACMQQFRALCAALADERRSDMTVEALGIPTHDARFDFLRSIRSEIVDDLQWRAITDLMSLPANARYRVVEERSGSNRPANVTVVAVIPGPGVDVIRRFVLPQTQHRNAELEIVALPERITTRLGSIIQEFETAHSAPPTTGAHNLAVWVRHFPQLTREVQRARNCQTIVDQRSNSLSIEQVVRLLLRKAARTIYDDPEYTDALNVAVAATVRRISAIQP